MEAEEVKRPGILGPSLKVGAACGTLGFLQGGTVGILRGTTPFLFATVSGIQTFSLGYTFWYCRSLLLRTRLAANQKPNDLITVSTLAGGLSGTLLAGLTRGRNSLLPAAIMWSLTGGVGQAAYTKWESKTIEDVSSERSKGFWERIAAKSWSPMKFISNEDYADMLREKVLKLDVEIAVIDDRIEALKAEGVKKEILDQNSEPNPGS
ncbi:hypothetical protein LTR78_000672 [Recurvomyces mirabilis]|uniref:Uncharacterized protein n=1 Tax=Recurvomyces mirabilis TaxID=574656 RepID=A0AAE0WY85_9PEZI|nr:hypothetical protein LTR78_000672 [Recurvomyces mirabilis]KAK5162326.1 hypothetical protein LTS14_000673 [Recurvomyces mirabilis]